MKLADAVEGGRLYITLKGLMNANEVGTVPLAAWDAAHSEWLAWGYAPGRSASDRIAARRWARYQMGDAWRA